MDYGQRHAVEIEAAVRIARALGAAGHRIQKLDLTQIGGSALTDRSIAIPVSGIQPGIPVTYVPARNTILLSLALGWAEVLGALVHLPKAEIVRLALELGVDPAMTVSCYQPDVEGRACGVCDACRIRKAGFEAAGTADSTRYTRS